MRPPPFAYTDPQSVDEATGVLAQYGDDARILAGGQSFVPLLNFRLAQPKYIIDINKISALDHIKPLDGGLVIGALTRHRAVEQSNLVRDSCPLLHQAIRHVGHIQIRNRGTIGGSLAHADPAAELPAVITALDGRLHLRSASGERKLGSEEFFLAHLTTATEAEEMLVAVELPAWPADGGACFTEFSRRQGDFALVGAGAVLALDSDGRVARVGLALMGVGGRPFDGAPIASDILLGEKPDTARIEEVAKRIGESVEPDSDIHAPADYRKHLAGIMTRRALFGAMQHSDAEGKAR